MTTARHVVCTWCESVFELVEPVDVGTDALVAVWCPACREIVPAFVVGGRAERRCAAAWRLESGAVYILGGQVDDRDN